MDAAFKRARGSAAGGSGEGARRDRAALEAAEDVLDDFSEQVTCSLPRVVRRRDGGQLFQVQAAR